MCRVRVRLKPGKRLTVQTKRIGLEPHQTRAFTESALKRQPEILDLAKRNVIKMSPIVFALPPAPSSYGYDEGFYVCDECGGPIIFRYSPPRPIHV
ncbi:MAG: hypothetical protein HYX26_03850 [Acidobacteriales bacterium]|nr:hypothetical protein [Terriglobales bacterium]